MEEEFGGRSTAKLDPKSSFVGQLNPFVNEFEKQ